ncbi:ArnT family glycosyltransferase [Bdellovibrio bacteriovorus]|uniref:ArnT family glycosyltransferase n=1 Tax=Bdellovibrio bacteriovorus TaxID=959 RepID=UPI0035A60B28
MSKKVSGLLTTLLFLTIAIFLSSLWRRIIHIDDVWLAEYSYWLNKLGYVKSEAMRGFYSAESKLFVYHKLLAIEGAWLIHWFGFKPYVLKSLSLVYLAGSLVLLSKIYRRYAPQRTGTVLLITLFLSFFHTMNLSFTFRPEMHLVFWGLLNFWYLDKYLDTNKPTMLLLSGFFTGVGIATHLNGVVFAGASVLTLWIQRRWWPGFILGIVATWGLIFFFAYDTRSLDDLQLLFAQLTNWRDVATGKYGWESLFRIFTEQGRYLHSPPEMLYTLMLLLLLIPSRKYLIHQQKRVLYYLGLLFVCVAQITHGQNTNYLMYCLPFFILLATWSFEKLLSEKRPLLAWTSVGIFVVGSWVYNLAHFNQREDMLPEFQKVSLFLPEGAKVLAPHYLIFPAIDKLRIQSFITYRDKVENKVLEQNAPALFKEAIQFDIEYVVVDKSNREFFHIVDDEYAPFQMLAEQPSAKFKIYKRTF